MNQAISGVKFLWIFCNLTGVILGGIYVIDNTI